MKTPDSVGYLQLLRQNADFRRLWCGQVISGMGDWLNAVALYSLVESLTGSGKAVAWVVMLQFLPFFFWSPVSGVVADRLPRRAIMIFADLVRAVTILGLLFIRRSDQVWMVYVIVALTDTMTAFFEPARQATIPSLCKREELFAANALSSLTWSVTLAVGAGVGGLITYFVGRQGTFILDSISFLLSAFFIWRIRTRQIQAKKSDEESGHTASAAGWRSSFTELREGFSFLRQRPAVISFLLVKTAAGFGGGILVLLTMFGQRLFPIGKAGTAVGLLYAARGLGTALGPMLARRLGGTSSRALRLGIGWAFLIYGAFYIVFGQSPNLVMAMLALIVAHLGGSVQWTNSTMLLQLSVPDRFRGRIFAWEWGLLTLAAATSNFVVGWMLDTLHFTPRQAATCIGTYLLLPAVVWAILQFRLGSDYTKTSKAEEGFEPVAKTA